MKLTNRQTHVLRMLSQCKEPVAMADIAQHVGVSLRTAYYDVAALEEYILQLGSGLISIVKRRMVCRDIPWDRVDQLPTSTDYYYPEAVERRMMMPIYIALSRGRTTIKFLMEKFNLSRNTVIADVRELKNYVQGSHVELVSFQGIGYQFDGDERQIRSILWRALHSIRDPSWLSSVQDLLQTSLVGITHNNLDYLELSRWLVEQYEHDTDSQVLIDTTHTELMMLEIAWLRSCEGFHPHMDHDEQLTLMGTLHYQALQCCALKLQHNGIMVPPDEVLYMTALMLGRTTATFDDSENQDESVRSLAHRLTTSFECVRCLKFIDKALTCNQISNYIRPLYYRHTYGLQAPQRFTNDVRTSYPITFEFTRRAAHNAGLMDISDDEIGSLALCLSASLNQPRCEDAEQSSAGQVLVVGKDAYAALPIIKHQINDACGILVDYNVLSLKK